MLQIRGLILEARLLAVLGEYSRMVTMVWATVTSVTGQRLCIVQHVWSVTAAVCRVHLYSIDGHVHVGKRL